MEIDKSLGAGQKRGASIDIMMKKKNDVRDVFRAKEISKVQFP